MPVSSINFKNVKPNSEAHNERTEKLDYNFPILEKDNEHWKNASVSEAQTNIKALCKKLSGRKLQKNAHSVREAVVNMEKHHTMDDLKRLGDVLKASYGISCFQIHIHRDEGKSPLELNSHAHMLFDWQDKDKGTMLRIKSHDLANIQTLVAETLGMKRGQERVNGKAVNQRLEPKAYKLKQDLAKLKTQIDKGKEKYYKQASDTNEEFMEMKFLEMTNKELQELNDSLEQKKNRLEPFNFSQRKLQETELEIRDIESRIKKLAVKAKK